MTDQEVLPDDDFRRCIDFHGHICPGLATGYRAAKAGFSWLKENRADDEEVVAIVETDSCSADAIQVITGCTFGKGNFLYKDYGKQVFTLLSRKSGHGVRVALKSGAITYSDRHRTLIERMGGDELSEEERKRLWELQRQKAREVLGIGLEDLFTMKSVSMPMPPKARIEPSRPCSRCGEPTMVSRLRECNGEYICKDCLSMP